MDYTKTEDEELLQELGEDIVYPEEFFESSGFDEFMAMGHNVGDFVGNELEKGSPPKIFEQEKHLDLKNMSYEERVLWEELKKINKIVEIQPKIKGKKEVSVLYKECCFFFPIIVKKYFTVCIRRYKYQKGKFKSEGKDDDVGNFFEITIPSAQGRQRCLCLKLGVDDTREDKFMCIVFKKNDRNIDFIISPKFKLRKVKHVKDENLPVCVGFDNTGEITVDSREIKIHGGNDYPCVKYMPYNPMISCNDTGNILHAQCIHPESSPHSGGELLVILSKVDKVSLLKAHRVMNNPRKKHTFKLHFGDYETTTNEHGKKLVKNVDYFTGIPCFYSDFVDTAYVYTMDKKSVIRNKNNFIEMYFGKKLKSIQPTQYAITCVVPPIEEKFFKNRKVLYVDILFGDKQNFFLLVKNGFRYVRKTPKTKVGINVKSPKSGTSGGGSHFFGSGFGNDSFKKSQGNMGNFNNWPGGNQYFPSFGNMGGNQGSGFGNRYGQRTFNEQIPLYDEFVNCKEPKKMEIFKGVYDYSKQGVLIHAAARGDMELVKALIDFGYDPSYTDITGYSCLEWSEYNKEYEVASYLRSVILRKKIQTFPLIRFVVVHDEKQKRFYYSEENITDNLERKIKLYYDKIKTHSKEGKYLKLVDLTFNCYSCNSSNDFVIMCLAEVKDRSTAVDSTIMHFLMDTLKSLKIKDINENKGKIQQLLIVELAHYSVAAVGKEKNIFEGSPVFLEKEHDFSFTFMEKDLEVLLQTKPRKSGLFSKLDWFGLFGSPNEYCTKDFSAMKSLSSSNIFQSKTRSKLLKLYDIKRRRGDFKDTFYGKEIGKWEENDVVEWLKHCIWSGNRVLYSLPPVVGFFKKFLVDGKFVIGDDFSKLMEENLKGELKKKGHTEDDVVDITRVIMTEVATLKRGDYFETFLVRIIQQKLVKTSLSLKNIEKSFKPYYKQILEEKEKNKLRKKILHKHVVGNVIFEIYRTEHDYIERMLVALGKIVLIITNLFSILHDDSKLILLQMKNAMESLLINIHLQFLSKLQSVIKNNLKKSSFFDEGCQKEIVDQILEFYELFQLKEYLHIYYYFLEQKEKFVKFVKDKKGVISKIIGCEEDGCGKFFNNVLLEPINRITKYGTLYSQLSNLNQGKLVKNGKKMVLTKLVDMFCCVSLKHSLRKNVKGFC